MHSNSGGVAGERDPTPPPTPPPAPTPPHSNPLILSPVFIFVALILPVSFPSPLNSSKFPPKELMTRLKHEPNQGQALMHRQTRRRLSLDPTVD